MKVAGVSVSVDVSEQDGFAVVQIDTDSETVPENTSGPQIRVHLNDGCIFNNTPLHDGKVGW